MKIGLIDVDSHNFPNLPLMKLSAYHKACGDTVDWWNGLDFYDLVYQSKVFDDTYSKDFQYPINASEIIRGGTGYGLSNTLPDEIEHIYPDYSIYPQYKAAYGFLTRGCPRDCPFCIVTQKEGRKSIKVADLSEFWRGQKQIKLLDPNLLACKDHEALLQQLICSNANVDFTQGLDIRFLSNDNLSLFKHIKTKNIYFAWDREKDSDLILRNLQKFKAETSIDYRKLTVYILTNYDTDFAFDLYRVTTVRDLGYTPYVMIYDKPHAPRKTRHLQGWANNKRIFYSVPNFNDFCITKRK